MSGQHFASVQCSYSRQQISPSQPATRSVRGLGMQCSDRRQRSTRMRTHPAQHCSTRSLDQVRMCFVRMVGSSTGPLPRPLSRCCVAASVARLMPGHPIARVLETLVEGWYHSIASPYATQRRKQRDDLGQ